MPILKVRLCATPSSWTSARIASTLTDLTVELLKKKREFTAVAIKCLAATEFHRPRSGARPAWCA